MTLIIAVGIALFAKVMAPIRKGTSEAFWYVACNADLDPNVKHEWIGQVVLREGWFIYELKHIHGSYLFRIPEFKAMLDFPKVLKQLDAELENADPNNFFLAGYREWKATNETERGGVKGLLEKIDEARASLLQSRSPEMDGYRRLKSYLLENRIRQAKWYWANLVFEFVFLSGLVWFAIWPIIRRKRPWRWALHLGPVPLFFMLPVYLGYATYTFTSAGPSGGVFYPWLLVFLRGGRMSQIDQIIIERLPQILEPLSQGIGMPMALTGMGLWGPTATVGCSLVVAVAAFAVGWWVKNKSKINQKTNTE